MSERMTPRDWLACVEGIQPGCSLHLIRANDGLSVTVHHEAAGGWRVSTVATAGALGCRGGLTAVEAARHCIHLATHSRLLRRLDVDQVGDADGNRSVA